MKNTLIQTTFCPKIGVHYSNPDLENVSAMAVLYFLCRSRINKSNYMLLIVRW